MTERSYKFLNDKFKAFLIPSILLTISPKIASILDSVMAASALSPSALAVIGFTGTFCYYNSFLLSIFGLAGSLMAGSAKANFNNDKANHYFTISLVFAILTSLIYLLIIIVFHVPIMNLFNISPELFGPTESFLLISIFHFPFNYFIMVLSYYASLDGLPRLSLYAILIANITNTILDFVLGVKLGMGLNGFALATVIGYALGTAYALSYFFNKKRNFSLVSLTKQNLDSVSSLLKRMILTSSESVGKVFFALKMSLLVFLTSTYYGPVGIIALTIYDNSETFTYMILSGIMKTMSSIISVLFSSKDYNAVYYIVKNSLRLLLVVSLSVSLIFLAFPSILTTLFHVTIPSDMYFVETVIKITAIGLIGRSFSQLFATYSQAIGKNKISSYMYLVQEFIIAMVGSIILVCLIGPIGIWIAIVLSEIAPLILYVIYSKVTAKKEHLDNLYFLPESEYLELSISKENWDSSIKDINSLLSKYIKEDLSTVNLIFKSLSNYAFNKNDDIDSVDVLIKTGEDSVLISLTDDGLPFNPTEILENLDDEQIELVNKIKNEIEVSSLDIDVDYINVLGFNKINININNLSF